MYCSFISHSAKRLSSVVGTARCIRQKESGHCASSSYRGSPRVFVRMHYIILFYIFAILVPWQGILIWRAFPNTHTHLVHTNPSGMAWHVYDRKPIWRRIHVQKEMWSIVGCNANCRVWEGKRENLCECFFTAIKWVFCHSLPLPLSLLSHSRQWQGHCIRFWLLHRTGIYENKIFARGWSKENRSSLFSALSPFERPARSRCSWLEPLNPCCLLHTIIFFVQYSNTNFDILRGNGSHGGKRIFPS